MAENRQTLGEGNARILRFCCVSFTHFNQVSSSGVARAISPQPIAGAVLTRNACTMRVHLVWHVLVSGGSWETKTKGKKMKTFAPEVKQIARAAFPDYTGRKFRVEALAGAKRLDSYWSGGSRNYFVLLSLATMRQVALPQNGTPFDAVGTLELRELPINCALVEHCYFCGKDLGITVYARPENLTPLLS